MLTLAPCASAEACRRLAEVPSTSYSSCGPIGRRDGNRRRGLLPPLVRRGGSCGQRGRRSVLTHAIGGLPDDLSERLKRWAQRQKEQLQQAANGSWTSSGGGGPSSGISSSSSATGGNGAGSSSGSSSEPDPGKPRSVWSDWSGRDEDWDEWRSQVRGAGAAAEGYQSKWEAWAVGALPAISNMVVSVGWRPCRSMAVKTLTS